MLERYVLIKAIKAVVAEPNRSFSVRGLSADIGISPGAARTSLDYMHMKGIVSLKTVGKTYQYRADLQNALCRQWKILFNLDIINGSKVIQEIEKRIPNIQSILLYGSFARGTNGEKSDVDLLVVAHNPGKTDLGFINKLGKEVNISVLSMADWKKKAVQDKVFYENTIYDSIVLAGERPVVL